MMQKLPFLLRLMLRRSRKGPPARYGVRWEPGLPVPGADGDLLLTDHYAPVTDEPCPTVLLRAPYLRIGFPFNWLYGALFAEQGFHVLLQSTRGTGGSGGEFHFWRNETADGLATVEWIREQEWFTGDLYTVGASYTAFTQTALAADPPPEWRGAVMQVGQTDPHEFFWGGGAFRLERALVGGIGLFTGRAMTARKYFQAGVRLGLRLGRVSRRVPLLDAYPSLFSGRRPAFEEWLDHPEPEWWAPADVRSTSDTLKVPVSLSTGWWDLEPGQVIEQYQRLRANGTEADLIIGPWTHTSSLERGWAELFEQALRRLRGEPALYDVRVHVGGVNEWRDLPSWPPPGARSQVVTLAEWAGDGETSFRYDPADPTPSIGGPLQSPSQGQRDNAPLEKRDDVVLFTGPPLEAPLQVMGPVHAEFDASTTSRSGDLFVRLCDVDPSGRSINICDGLTRFGPDRGTSVIVDMGHAAHVFRPGHRVRLLVAGGAHPRYLRNYGTGEPVATATRMVPTTTSVRHTSALVLTVV